MIRAVATIFIVKLMLLDALLIAACIALEDERSE